MSQRSTVIDEMKHALKTKTTYDIHVTPQMFASWINNLSDAESSEETRLVQIENRMNRLESDWGLKAK